MTDPIPELPWTWDGEALRPLSPHWARIADRHLVVGQSYTLVEKQERSGKTHAHYFASVTDLWRSLPEGLALGMPSADHARKRALIQTGYRTQQDIACASRAEAMRLAAVVRSLDAYAVVVLAGPVVSILRAQSQDYRSMDRATFAASKQAVLDYLSDLVGVPAGERVEHAGRRAA